MTETATECKYYQALSYIMKAEDLPNFLSLIKEGLQNISSKIYYKEYQVSRSVTGRSAFYSLNIFNNGKADLKRNG